MKTILYQVQITDRDYLFSTKCLSISKLKSQTILNMSCMFVSFVRPIEFSISRSVSLEELRLRQNVSIKSFYCPQIFAPKCIL